MRAALATTAVAALVLAGLTATLSPTYADAAGVSGTSTLSADAVVDGYPTSSQGATTEHGGIFDGYYSAESGKGPTTPWHGGATTTQHVVATTAAVTATGSVTGSAVAQFSAASAAAQSNLDLSWTPAVSGTWRLLVDVTATGAGTGSIAVFPAGGAPLVHESIDAAHSPYHYDAVLSFAAGSTVMISPWATVDLTADTAGTWSVGGTASWSVQLIPTTPVCTLKPAVTGTKRVGKRVTATTGTWTESPASFSYRWLRKGKPIAGATHRSYTLKKADQGKRIAVRVTAHRTGAPAASATSPGYLIKKKKG